MILQTLFDCILYVFLLAVPVLPFLYAAMIPVAEGLINAFNSWRSDDDDGDR